ncbi:MAG: hypothetical protein II631_02760 [Treponema sp.]|nr:hypothetical protein [Treponema sp.]
MNYCKALPSCKEKILTWNKEDFSTFAASMSNEEIRSMARELLDSCYFPSFAEDHPDAIVLDYIYLLAYEAELANNHEEAAKLYEIFEIF